MIRDGFNFKLIHFTIEALSLIFFGLTSLTACSPQGEPTRSIYPPHEFFRKTEKISSIKLAESESHTKSEPGLPPSCMLERLDKSLLCLRCQLTPWHIQRCFLYEGISIDPEHCVHTRDSLKCLFKEPAFVVKMTLKNPQEKLLNLNFEQWKDAVLTVWNNQIDQDNKEELMAILGFMEELTRLSTQTDLDKLNDSDLITLLTDRIESDKKPVKELRKLLADIQKAKIKGDLNLSLLVTETRTFFQRRAPASETWNFLSNVSLEGLEPQDFKD